MNSGTLLRLLFHLKKQAHLEAEWQRPWEKGGPARHAYRLTPSDIKLARANPPDEAAAERSGRREATT